VKSRASRCRAWGWGQTELINLATMTEITHREVETNGIKMHVAEAGEGPLVVLLHGFPEGWYSGCWPSSRNRAPSWWATTGALRSHGTLPSFGQTWSAAWWGCQCPIGLEARGRLSRSIASISASAFTTAVNS
jgi:hypothetical protein